ncbi:MAG: hypothetical protein K6F54_00695 [Lachnospiraceae bacterium]|nr:hypothetical protein [Lachnospiraceae bacterium]
MDNNSIDLEEIVDGRPLREWLKSDEGMVDYDKLEFGHNVSNTEDYLIYDLGMFYHDSSVGETRYHNGVDLARVAAVNVMGAYRPIEYDTVDLYSALEGDDYTRIFFNSVRNATIADFIFRFFKIIDGDLYISETCHHVFIKGRFGTSEERKAFVENYNSRIIS